MNTFFLFLNIFISQVQAAPKFYCFQGNLAQNQVIESGFTDCGKDDEPTGETIKERKTICVEPAYCAPDTDELRELLAPALEKKQKTFEKLSAFEVGKFIQDYDNANGGQTKYAKNSYLICAMKNGACPLPTECQEDLLYNVKGVMTTDVVNYTTYPKIRVRPTSK